VKLLRDGVQDVVMIPAILEGMARGTGARNARVVVDHVVPFPEFLYNSVWLLCEVNLKPYMKHDVVLLFRAIGNTAGERDDGYKVDKSGAIFSIIEKMCLALLVVGEALPHVCNSFWVGILTEFSFDNAAARCLEETAVTTKDLILVVPCHTIEGGGGIYDGAVVSPNVHYDERTRHINRAEVDARTLSIGDAN
jgi:hypothetical protein